MTPLDPYLAARETLTQDGFLQKYPNPVLVFAGLAAVLPVDQRSMGFKTQPSHRRALSDEASRPGPGAMSLHSVYHLVKNAHAVYSDRVSVGRTRTSDIHLPYPQVSKFHAYFTWSDDKKQFFLADAGSANGTYVTEKSITQGIRVALESGVIVAFGPYRFFFFDPPGFHAFLGTVRP